MIYSWRDGSGEARCEASLSSHIVRGARQVRRCIFNYPHGQGTKEDPRDAAKATRRVAKWYHLVLMAGAWLLLAGNLLFLPRFLSSVHVENRGCPSPLTLTDIINTEIICVATLSDDLVNYIYFNFVILDIAYFCWRNSRLISRRLFITSGAFCTIVSSLTFARRNALRRKGDGPSRGTGRISFGI